jgi:hypothetical protein
VKRTLKRELKAFETGNTKGIGTSNLTVASTSGA